MKCKMLKAVPMKIPLTLNKISKNISCNKPSALSMISSPISCLMITMHRSLSPSLYRKHLMSTNLAISTLICKLNSLNFNLVIRILMKGITWARDSHGLFDYESRHLTKKTMKTEQEIVIMRHANELT